MVLRENDALRGNVGDKSRVFNENSAIQDAIAEHLALGGYPRCEPPILQPASSFFDSGEDIRSQLYLTSDISGAEYCLRPEYTIPVCRDYLASPLAGQKASFSYCGPVFRYRAGRPSEFIQAGLESFGRTDKEAADAEILALALEAVSKVGQRQDQAQNLELRIADAGLFFSLLDALDLSPQWRRRILRGQIESKPLAHIFGLSLNLAQAEHSGLLAMLEGADRQGARALVESLLSIADIAAVGGRTAAEIADRFLEQAALQTSAGLPRETQEIIEQFLAIKGDPDRALNELRRLTDAAKLDFSASLDRFEARLGFIAARGIGIETLNFATSFSRNLDYYTGFMFEAHDRTLPRAKPVFGGGRYDNLLQSLGAGENIPAVGAAIWIEPLQIKMMGDRA
jgi:ATP phosphoribosyltransferase regulatory subunit